MCPGRGMIRAARIEIFTIQKTKHPVSAGCWYLNCLAIGPLSKNHRLVFLFKLNHARVVCFYLLPEMDWRMQAIYLHAGELANLVQDFGLSLHDKLADDIALGVAWIDFYTGAVTAFPLVMAEINDLPCKHNIPFCSPHLCRSS
jgi:hypothetical protein